MKNTDSIKQSVIQSLDGRDEELYPFLHYLLQDLWEIGTSPVHLIDLIERHKLAEKIKTALDLGCGKGAVSIQMAKHFGWHVHGIDAMPEFIEGAQQRSQTFGTAKRVSFELGDIRSAVKHARDYDLVILGSIGPVLGSIIETLSAVKSCLVPGGYVLLDDVYQRMDGHSAAGDAPDRAAVLQQIHGSSLKIIEEFVYDHDYLAMSNQAIFAAIQKRAIELETAQPEKKHFFRAYVAQQAHENKVLEEDVECVTWLLKK